LYIQIEEDDTLEKKKNAYSYSVNRPVVVEQSKKVGYHLCMMGPKPSIALKALFFFFYKTFNFSFSLLCLLVRKIG